MILRHAASTSTLSSRFSVGGKLAPLHMIMLDPSLWNPLVTFDAGLVAALSLVVVVGLGAGAKGLGPERFTTCWNSSRVRGQCPLSVPHEFELGLAWFEPADAAGLRCACKTGLSVVLPGPAISELKDSGDMGL